MNANHNQPARIVRVELLWELVGAVESYLVQAHDNVLAEDASCDHSVGICWCDYIAAIETLKALLGKIHKQYDPKP